MSALRQTAMFPVVQRSAQAGYSVTRSQATRVEVSPRTTGSSRLVLSTHASATTKGEGVVLALDVAAERLDEAAMRNYVSRLWSEDWDSPEDSVYDSW